MTKTNNETQTVELNGIFEEIDKTTSEILKRKEELNKECAKADLWTRASVIGISLSVSLIGGLALYKLGH